MADTTCAVGTFVVQLLQFLALAATFVVILLYRNHARDANRISVAAEFHKHLNSLESRRTRRYLHRDFDSHLRKACRECGIPGPVDLMELEEPKTAQPGTLQKFNDCLRRITLGGSHDMSALDAIESTLGDFDSIAILVWHGSDPGRRASKDYKGVLNALKPHLVPFIRMQRGLRGDKAYKGHLIYFLSAIGVIEEADLAVYESPPSTRTTALLRLLVGTHSVSRLAKEELGKGDIWGFKITFRR